VVEKSERKAGKTERLKTEKDEACFSIAGFGVGFC